MLECFYQVLSVFLTMSRIKFTAHYQITSFKCHLRFLYSFLRIKSKTRTKKLYRKVALDVVGLFNANNIKMQRKYSVVKHRPISKLLVLLKFTFLAFCVAGPGVESA